MVLQTIGGHRIGEDITDLQRWVHSLEGCPTVTNTVIAECTEPAHVDEPGMWFYVEADPTDALARRRCLSCGHVAHILDSEERWAAPKMWSCHTCGQSIAEVVAGLHAPPANGESGEPGPVTWVAIGVRCVGCGALDGVADFVVPGLSYDDVAARV